MDTPAKRGKGRFPKAQTGKSREPLIGKRDGSFSEQRGSKKRKTEESFFVRKVSPDEMASALIELGVVDPKHNPHVNRLVVIEIARGKRKIAAKKTLKAQPGHERTAADDSARKAEVVAHATEALDGQANAMSWLQRPNRSLAGRSPLDILTNGKADDIDRIDELLYAIEYGMYV